MATKIITKNSSTATSIPTAGDLVQGELAVNVTDKRLFTEDSGGAIVELGTNPSTIDINGGTIDGTTIGATTPASVAATTLSTTGAVGIDNSAPSKLLTVGSTTTVNPTIRMLSSLTAGSDTSTYSFGLDDSTDFAGLKFDFSDRVTKGLQVFTASGYGYPITFSASSANSQMTLDASGNLLVGKTTDAFGTAGIALRGTVADFTRDGGTPINVNRLTSDGSLIDFHKAGAPVGSIGVWDGDFVIGQVNVAFKFDDDSNKILPWSVQSNLNRDNGITLGAANARWKDLYLSGGVYLGGTGAANHLDDYEEGTWIPTVQQGTITSTFCTYTKVGRLVTVSGNIDNFSDRTTVDRITISNLPFTCASGILAVSAMMHAYVSGSSSIFGYSSSNSTSFGFYRSTTSGALTNVNHSELTSVSSGFYFTHTYTAT